MDCERVAELLPWLLNGTLDAAEREEVEAHLEGCARCGQELEDTAFAGRVFRQHLPPEVLVDYGFGRETEGFDRAVIESHLEHCSQCAEELEMVRESHRSEQEDEPGAAVLPFQPRGTTPKPGPSRGVSDWWRTAALAAGFLGVVVGAGWLWSVLQLADQRSAWERREAELLDRIEQGPAGGNQEELERRLAEAREEQERLAGEIEREREEVSRLGEQVAALEAPQLNVWVADVAPSDTVLRSEEEPVTLTVPPGVETFTLLLRPPSSLAPSTGGATGEATGEEPATFDLELLDEAGARRWRKEGLRLQPEGDFTVSLRRATVPTRFTLRLLAREGGERREVARYPIVIRSGR